MATLRDAAFILSARRDQIRALLTRLAFAHDEARREELIAALRDAAAEVRRARAILQANRTDHSEATTAVDFSPTGIRRSSCDVPAHTT